MDIETRRAPLPNGGRRLSLNVNLELATIQALEHIAGGNRSAAIEALVREHLKRVQHPESASA